MLEGNCQLCCLEGRPAGWFSPSPKIPISSIQPPFFPRFIHSVTHLTGPNGPPKCSFLSYSRQRGVVIWRWRNEENGSKGIGGWLAKRENEMAAFGPRPIFICIINVRYRLEDGMNARIRPSDEAGKKRQKMWMREGGMGWGVSAGDGPTGWNWDQRATNSGNWPRLAKTAFYALTPLNIPSSLFPFWKPKKGKNGWRRGIYRREERKNQKGHTMRATNDPTNFSEAFSSSNIF